MVFKYYPEDVQIARDYLSGEIPKMRPRDLARFERKYDVQVKKEKGKWIMSQDGKPIIFKDDIPVFLRDFYEDPNHGFVSRDKLYAKIKENYVGISKRDIQEFLNNSET